VATKGTTVTSLWKTSTLIIVAAFTLSACSPAPTPAVELSNTTEVPVAPDETGPEAPGDTACEVAIQQGISATISTQIDALAQEDFATAYSMASPYFQAQFSQDSFTRVITEGYSFLLDGPRITLSDCLFDRDLKQAQTRVTVTADSGEIFILNYQMSEVDESWRIDGAALNGAGSNDT
jgi:hypothetical protein